MAGKSMRSARARNPGIRSDGTAPANRTSAAMPRRAAAACGCSWMRRRRGRGRGRRRPRPTWRWTSRHSARRTWAAPGYGTRSSRPGRTSIEPMRSPRRMPCCARSTSCGARHTS